MARVAQLRDKRRHGGRCLRLRSTARVFGGSAGWLGVRIHVEHDHIQFWPPGLKCCWILALLDALALSLTRACDLWMIHIRSVEATQLARLFRKAGTEISHTVEIPVYILPAVKATNRANALINPLRPLPGQARP
jgi:hypothetical protein